MTSILSAVTQFTMQSSFEIDLGWLANFVKIIIEGVGIVGWGVIVFTLILKAITTPFDIYQRVKMRKQTLVMRSMQADLEKLQKQYANDKDAYSRKMLELQKKNGIGLLSSCLPMIISFVILIFAVTAFQSYANYANLSMYQGMAQSYNAAVLEYAPDAQDQSTITVTDYTDESSQAARVRIESSSEKCYLYYTCSKEEYESDPLKADKFYYILIDKFYTEQKDAGFRDEISAFIAEFTGKPASEANSEEIALACNAWFKNEGAKAAAEHFRTTENPGFLWIKNVWYPDVSYKHPIQDYEDFISSISADIYDDKGAEKTLSDVFREDQYNDMTALLYEEKEQANGYYILIILTIALMVLSQLIMMKSQKETNQYQTVDGQGASMQKMMLFIMPLIYAITGFLWTAAFSIYIAVSSIFGIAITLISNLVLDRVFRKKEEEEIKARYTRTVPWKQDPEKAAKNGKKNKKKK